MQPLALFTILAPAAMLVALFAPKGFALIGALGGLAAWLLLWRQGRLHALWALPSSHVLLGLLGAGLLSALWSLDAGNTLQTMQGLGVLLIAVLGLLGLAQLAETDRTDVWQRRFALALVLSFAALALLLLQELLTRGGLQAWLIGLAKGEPTDWVPNRTIRSGVFVTLLLWPSLLAACWLTKRQPAWQRAGLPLLLFGIGALAAYASPQVNAKLALAGGGTVFVLVWLGGHIVTRLLGGLAILGVLALPFAMLLWFDASSIIADYPTLHYSAKHRLHVWEFVVQRYAERPWLGWGIDAARILPGADAKLPSGGETLPSHPHNGILQYWLELGILGGLLLALAQAAIWRGLSLPGLSRLGRATAAAAYGTMVVYFLASFNSWHSWWAGMLAASAALVIAATRLYGRKAAAD